MDLITLLASAPPWVRSVVAVLTTVWMVATVITNALRFVPEERFVAIERVSPRLGQLLRAARKIGTDVMPAVAAFVAALLGRPVHPVAPPPPQPPAGQRGHASHGVLATIVALAAVVMLAAGCPPRPVPEPGPSQPVSGWTSTARAVLGTLRWALPAARAVTDSLLSDPPRTQVARALDAAADAAGRLDVALSAYESRGGDRCVAHAAAGGVVVALEQLADVLADNGIALGVVLGRVVDGAASIVDALVPACAADAGWTSAGDVANGRLRLVEDVARRRGIALRRDLDSITEPAR
jgi:hypothetical protein